jgi:hypothetical protein
MSMRSKSVGIEPEQEVAALIDGFDALNTAQGYTAFRPVVLRRTVGT